MNEVEGLKNQTLFPERSAGGILCDLPAPRVCTPGPGTGGHSWWDLARPRAQATSKQWDKVQMARDASHAALSGPGVLGGSTPGKGVELGLDTAELMTRGRRALGLLGTEGLRMLHGPGREADRGVRAEVEMLMMNSHGGSCKGGTARSGRPAGRQEATAGVLRLRSAGPEPATGRGYVDARV